MGPRMSKLVVMDYLERASLHRVPASGNAYLEIIPSYEFYDNKPFWTAEP